MARFRLRQVLLRLINVYLVSNAYICIYVGLCRKFVGGLIEFEETSVSLPQITACVATRN